MLLNKFTKDENKIEVTGITADSREVKPGYLFGSLNDDKFIEDAINKGAIAILVGEDACINAPDNVVVVRSKNPAKDFAKAASCFYGKQPQHIAAITGTNGKTSIADFTRQILTLMGYKAASNGTLGLIKGNNQPIPSQKIMLKSMTGYFDGEPFITIIA